MSSAASTQQNAPVPVQPCMGGTDSFFLQMNLSDEAASLALGGAIGEMLQPGDTVALAGTLGAGKTTVARALVRRFLPGEEVPSPTFTLVQTYDAPGFRIWHADLYRVRSPRELRELGFEEALDGGVLLVEWPDRMSGELPSDRLDVMLEHDDGAEDRRVKLVGRGSWAGRLRQAAARLRHELGGGRRP